MGRKHSKTFQLLSAGDMSGDVTTNSINIEQSDNVGLQMIWTGTPTGTIDVEVSNDDQTTWTALTLSATASPAGSADNFFYDLSELPAKHVRLKYNSSSGTGSLDVWATIKSMGA